MVHANHITSEAGDGWLTATGSNPYVVWKLSKYLDGGDYDFVGIHIECQQKGSSQFRGQVFWAKPGESFSENQSFTFNVKSGDLLIPLGSHPQWLNSTQIGAFRFDIDDYDSCSVFKVKPVTFMSLTR